MMDELGNNGIDQKPLLMVELVGLAGAGKTTLAGLMSEGDDDILIGAEIELRRMEHIPIFISHAPFFLSLSMRQGQGSRGLAWNEIKSMVYLEAWPRILRRQALKGATVILLDQGPIFKLATLHAFGPESLKDQSFAEWWNKILKRWAFNLDMIIWLDAPEVILKERINSRIKRHKVKGKTDQDVDKFLACYRTSYEQILGKLAAIGGPTPFHFDTSQASIEQIVDQVRMVCNMKRVESWC